MSIQNALNMAILGTIQGATAVTSLLAGTNSIYFLQAPDNATLPYIVWSYQSILEPNDTQHRISEVHALIRGYSSVSALAAGSINAQIDLLFHAKTLTVTGYADVRTERVEEVSLVEQEPNNARAWMSGGIYKILLEKN